MEITSEQVIDIPHNYSITRSTSGSTSSSIGFPIGRLNRSALISTRKRFSKAKKWTRVNGLISSMPWHAVFVYLNPLLIGVLQVKCQGAAMSPFEHHPGDMLTFLVATLIYCFAFAANIKCRRRRTSYARLSGHLALVFGSLSSVSLFSIFLPSLLGRLAFFSWIILPLVLFRRLIKYCLFRWPMKPIFQALSNVRNRFKGRNLVENPHSLA